MPARPATSRTAPPAWTSHLDMHTYGGYSHTTLFFHGAWTSHPSTLGMDLSLGNAHRGYSHTFLCLSCSRQLCYRTCELVTSYSYIPNLPTTQCSKRPQHKAPAAPPTHPTFVQLEILTPASCKMQYLPENNHCPPCV